MSLVLVADKVRHMLTTQRDEAMRIITFRRRMERFEPKGRNKKWLKCRRKIKERAGE